MTGILFLVVGLCAYLLGSINTSILVSKVYGTDIRLHGSGNAGLTNALRVLGKGAAVLVLIGDILKGVLAICIARLFMTVFVNLVRVSIEQPEIYVYFSGFCVIVGHIFPIYFKFKGGKGILTSATVIAILQPQLALWLIAVFFVIVLLTRYVSLGSICSALVLMIAPFFFLRDDVWFLTFAVCIGGLAIWMHRSNIHRLLQGTENKLGQKHKGGE